MRLRLLLLLLAAVAWQHSSSAAGTAPGKRQLKRSHARRWESIHEVVRAQIKSATRHFLTERDKELILPIEVDIMLVGFDGDGGYGYTVDRGELEELLGSATEDNTICPTVWETGETAAVCFSINYLTLESDKVAEAINRYEQALVSNMEWVGDRSQDWPDGSKEVQVFEVEANGEVEATVWDLLDEAYGGATPEVNRNQHSQIVIVNPSKRRMRARLPYVQQTYFGGAVGAAAKAALEAVAAGSPPPPQEVPEQLDFITEWKKGGINSSHVVEQEAGFLYRYRYGGRGGAAAFVGQYNFLLIDISAGPVSYGPLASPGGAVAPSGVPRLMPMILRMNRELEATTQVGTLREHLLNEAATGQAAVFAGQLAATVAAASRHLFASDLLLSAADALSLPPGAEAGGMRSPRRVAVPIVIMQDHTRELEAEEGGARWVDTDSVQLALDELLPPDTVAAVSVSRHLLAHHKGLAAALVKARHTRADAVMATPPDPGLHRSQSLSLDSGALLRELRLAAGDDTLVGGLAAHIADDYQARLPYIDEADVWLERKRHHTKVLPVFVFSLERAPDQMMFDNRALVAASPDAVAVLQLLGNPSMDDYARGRTYSGHMAEGHHLLLDASEPPTRSVIAGLASALGGLVPPHARFCPAERAVVEDWRWAVGAVPWGPYSNYTAISSIFAATARRNALVARIERPLRRLIAALDRVDAFIAQHLQSPFPFLHLSDPDAAAAAASGNFGGLLPRHHLLDDLARQHVAYRNGTPTVGKAVGRMVGRAANATARVLSAAAAADAAAAGGHAHTAPTPTSSSSSSGSSKSGSSSGSSKGGSSSGGDATIDYPADLPVDDGSSVPDTSGGSGSGGEGGEKVALLEEQSILTPNVAARLQVALEEIGGKLERISFHMYRRSWADLEDELPSLAAAVEAFVGASERDLRHAAEVVACCAVRHVPRGATTWFILSVVLLSVGAFGILAYAAIRSQQLYAPPRPAARTMSRGRSLSGSLPTWAGPGSMSSMGSGGLPR